MKTILCYGDSLTWGSNPEGGGRHPFEDRWPSVLGEKLGADKVRIIAEGLGGRTTAFDDPTALADRNGARILPTLLGSHEPLDLVIIFLGTNDIKDFVCGNASAAARGMGLLVEMVQSYPYNNGVVPDVVMVSPPHCCETDNLDLKLMFRGSVEESKLLAGEYQRMAEKLGCRYFDAASVAKASPLDGVHLDAQNTRAIGEALTPIVRDMLQV